MSIQSKNYKQFIKKSPILSLLKIKSFNLF